MREEQFSEQESLRLITQMIQQAKGGFHESGSSSILWGSVVAVCGLASFAQMHWGFKLPFDVWLLTLVAFIPQLFITIKESRSRVVRTHDESWMSNIWMVYGFSIFALVFYFNVVPCVTDRLLAQEGRTIFERSETGIEKPFRYFIPSSGSLLLLLYAIPTLITGLKFRYRPMTIGAIVCYCFFIASLFTATKWDMLFNGLAAIGNWLLPGLLLRSRYLTQKRGRNV